MKHPVSSELAEDPGGVVLHLPERRLRDNMEHETRESDVASNGSSNAIYNSENPPPRIRKTRTLRPLDEVRPYGQRLRFGFKLLRQG
jgi:hypothetical protein